MSDLVNFTGRKLVLSTGETVLSDELFRERPLVLVFLRHLGCVFCREHVHDVNRRADWNVCFVSMANEKDAENFRQRTQSPHKFACDPGARLYEEFGIKKGGPNQLYGPQTWSRAIEAVKKGNRQGRFIGDFRRLPGDFVIAQNGDIAFQYRGKTSADNASLKDIDAALARLSSV